MKLLNFELSPAAPTVTIRGAGRDWDLHNFVALSDVRRQGGQVFLTFRPVDLREPVGAWRTEVHDTAPCTLRFRGVTHFRDTGMAGADDDTLSLMSKLDVGRQPFVGDAPPAGLRFDMEGGRVIEVCAQSAELILVDNDAA
jgi:hypothetical protein